MQEEESDMEDWFYHFTRSSQSRGYSFTTHEECYDMAAFEITRFLREEEPRDMVVCCPIWRAGNIIKSNVRAIWDDDREVFVNEINTRTVRLVVHDQELRGMGEFNTLIMLTEGMPQWWPWQNLIPMLWRARDPQFVNIHCRPNRPDVFIVLPDTIETPSAKIPREMIR